MLDIPKHAWARDFLELNICNTALTETAPLKLKYARANNSLFMNKTIVKAIMKRTRLRNKFFKHRFETNGRL